MVSQRVRARAAFVGEMCGRYGLDELRRDSSLRSE
jgi:hypothetical protein